MIETAARRSLPLAEWPEVERRIWMARVYCQDRHSSTEPISKWRPATVKGIQGAYGRWLAWISEEHPGLLSKGPAERLTRETTELYVDELRSRQEDASIGTTLIRVQDVVRLFSPGFDGEWLRFVVSRLRHAPVPGRSAADSVVPSEALFGLGLDLMRSATAPTAMQETASILRHRDGLIIALLALCPMSAVELVGVRTGTGLPERLRGQRVGPPGQGTTDVPDLDFSWPIVLAEHLSHYVDVVRPALLAFASRSHARRSDRLWLCRNGSPLCRHALRSMLKRRIDDRFGKHSGRHASAGLLASGLREVGPTTA